MRTAITLTEADANALLALLQELPIKHLAVVVEIQRFLQAKFQEDAAAVTRAAEEAG
jgi:hypothetical protein